MKCHFFLLALLCLNQSAYAAAPRNMVYISAGKHQPFMDRSKEGTPTESVVAGFHIDKYLVTNLDFLKFVRANSKWQRSQALRIFSDKSYLSHWSSDLSFPKQIEQEPVRFVSWFAANEYCKSKGKTLPTILQWEYVAAANEKLRDASKNKAYRERILAWYSQPTKNTFQNVTTGFKNVWGVVGMHGIVWEWTLDFNTALVTGESREDSTINKNLFCGSGVLGAKDGTDYGAFMRFGFRSSLRGNYTVANLGFRCVKNTATSQVEVESHHSSKQYATHSTERVQNKGRRVID